MTNIKNVQALIETLRGKGGEAYSEKGRRNPIRDDTGELLTDWVRRSPKGYVVEVGTAYGLSMCHLYLGKPNGQFATIEFDKATAEQAKHSFKSAGMRVEVYAGRAEDVLARWRNPIGLLFLDAEKRLYLDHYLLAKKHLVPGAVVLADNVLDRAKECEPFVERIKKEAKYFQIELTECGLLVARF